MLLLLTGSQLSVSIFINNVRLAFVTSVTCNPPFLPPVRFHTNHESIVPAKHLRSLHAFRTPATLSLSHLNFSAEKYGEIGRPEIDLK